MSSSKKSGFKSALDFDVRQLSVMQAIIAEQMAMLAVIKTALPAEIAEQVQHCVHSGNRLLLYMASAGWASQVRFYQRDILTKLAESGHRKIGALQVKISPPILEPSPGRPVQLPSAENISLIRSQIEDKTDSDVLKQALLRLAETLDKRLQG
ncbi:MAG: DciA family protein [Methylococcales bacterium]|nr:DciA family protein [Methylococcales bacterium]